ncbi:alpha/beta-hydrolase [Auricularia subglabra TFB-10046 SS5]|nr:alpha/beta-hydrolase [Auricularia subglabra TFB-10046 SS5]
MLLLSAGLVLVVPAYARLSDVHVTSRQTEEPAPFDWYKLPASDNITWTPCFDGQQCARLTVPLDYSTPDGPKIQLALEMIPATDKENYHGTIILNPGGPSGAGTEHMQVFGPQVVEMFGPTFDILSFDPRGTGATIPRADCFTPENILPWLSGEVVAVREGDGSINMARARDQLRAAACAATLGGNGTETLDGTVEEWGSGRFMDTASVATDMLTIVEKLGEEKLQYYGISYGTVLGQYFATMYPDKVGRMIIDGVVDGQKWQRGQTWDMVEDADRVMEEFFKDCSLAGKEKCGIWEDSAEKVGQRFERIVADLRENPIPVVDSPSGPVVITADPILQAVYRTSLYFPLTGFPSIAAIATFIEARNPGPLTPTTPPDDYASMLPWNRPTEAFPAISCSDFPPLNDSLAEDTEIVNSANAMSRWGGPFAFTRLRITCGAWKIRAKNRLTKPIEGRLPVPALVVSNQWDPVTPLSAAKLVAARFGMRLLVQDAPGHCAFFSLSKCVTAAMRAYMIDGSLPAEGTVCQPDQIPIVGAANATQCTA